MVLQFEKNTACCIGELEIELEKTQSSVSSSVVENLTHGADIALQAHTLEAMKQRLRSQSNHS